MTTNIPPTERRLWAIAIQICTRKELDAAALVWLEHLTSRQAAQQLGISHGALQSRLTTARRRIVDHLERKAA